ncbi:MAG: T9SS type A sorting domain-containing protein [Bacillota bacterium]
MPATSVRSYSSVPENFALEQNYPNPFNPSTTIKFSIPQNGSVTLVIYNIIGEKVATLINGQDFKSGSYQVSFDGSKLASGVYLYRLNYGSNSMTKKMMLLK